MKNWLMLTVEFLVFNVGVPKMFGFLKKKVGDAVKSISEKLAGEEKKEKKEVPPAPTKPIEKVPEKVPAQKPEEKIVPEKPEPKVPEVAPEITKEPISAPKEPEPIPEIAEEQIEKPEEPKKESFTDRLINAVDKKKLSENFVDSALWDLEVALLENNVASDVSDKIIHDVRENLIGKSVKRINAEKIITESLKKSVLEILDRPKIDFKKILAEKKPTTILLLGFNGSGKTTSAAKLANHFMKENHSVVLAAGDSFRAAAIEQLTIHATNLKVPIIKHTYGADPAAVIFDARKHAESKSIDIVIADTAGRVHTDANLVRELDKIVRVNKPNLKFLVVESIAGNDVLGQAHVFESIGIDGIILTKWDVDEKGGAALSLCHALKKPIVFLGTGQEYDDFEEFDAKEAVESII